MFFGTLFVRTPGYLKHIQQQYSRELQQRLKLSTQSKTEFHKSYKEAGIKVDKETIESDRQAILNNEIEIQPHQNLSLSFMLNMGLFNSKLLQNMNWALIKTDDNYPFIASDNPLNLINPNIILGFYKPGLGTKGSCVFTPISILLFNDG